MREMLHQITDAQRVGTKNVCGAAIYAHDIQIRGRVILEIAGSVPDGSKGEECSQLVRRMIAIDVANSVVRLCATEPKQSRLCLRASGRTRCSRAASRVWGRPFSSLAFAEHIKPHAGCRLTGQIALRNGGFERSPKTCWMSIE